VSGTTKSALYKYTYLYLYYTVDPAKSTIHLNDVAVSFEISPRPCYHSFIVFHLNTIVLETIQKAPLAEAKTTLGEQKTRSVEHRYFVPLPKFCEKNKCH